MALRTVAKRKKMQQHSENEETCDPSQNDRQPAPRGLLGVMGANHGWEVGSGKNNTGFTTADARSQDRLLPSLKRRKSRQSLRPTQNPDCLFP